LKSDIYSLGVLYFEIWSEGMLPLANYSNEECLEEIIRKHIHPFQPQKLSNELWKTVAKCYEVDESKRPNAKDLCDVFIKSKTDILIVPTKKYCNY